MKKSLVFTILIAVVLVAVSAAQSTEGSRVVFDHWGENVHGIRLSIALTNSIVSTDSELVVFVRMENSSTNVIYIGDSSPEADFVVLLKSDSGKMYQLTQRPWVHSRFMLTTLDPGESRDWIIHLRVSRYYEPPGIIPTKKNVPPGHYTLEVSRKFIPTKTSKPVSIQANLLKVQIE